VVATCGGGVGGVQKVLSTCGGERLARGGEGSLCGRREKKMLGNAGVWGGCSEALWGERRA